jgi:succinate dehydrogenase / fumarate reductase, flavoprotein subunit
MNDALAPFQGTGENPYAIQSDLQNAMQRLVGITRTEDDMRKALVELETLRQRARTMAVQGHREYNPGWHTAIDLGNLLTISTIIARCAVERTESRGAHFREDHPEKDATWGTLNLVVRKGDEDVDLERRTVEPIREDLKTIIEQQR